MGQALLFARNKLVFPLLHVAAFVLVAASLDGCRGVSTATAATGGPATLADLERLKTLVPSQSHSMADVGFHWTNLWFAGEQKNWPLAQFYFDEARQHIQWTIRIRPIRKDPEGRDVDLPAIFCDVGFLRSVAFGTDRCFGSTCFRPRVRIANSSKNATKSVGCIRRKRSNK